MPRVTVRWRRTRATACSTRSRSSTVSSSRPMVTRAMRRRILLISSSEGMASAACPLVDVAGGEQPFPVAQQVIEVGVQVGQVGDVGAEVVAAGAAEPERAGLAAGLDVGRFGADPERDGDLADRAAGVLGVQQRLGLAPDPVAVPVELHRSDPVDGLAATAVADAVVVLGGVEADVVHQRARARRSGPRRRRAVERSCAGRRTARSGSCRTRSHRRWSAPAGCRSRRGGAHARCASVMARRPCGLRGRRAAASAPPAGCRGTVLGPDPCWSLITSAVCLGDR